MILEQKCKFGYESKPAKTIVLGNFSKIILINTVKGMAIIKPGIPQMYPQSISITKMAIMLIEKDLPINIGSKTPPNNT